MDKLVSIAMGIYNCEETLGEAIKSIINQTYENWELILCDDGSTDKTMTIANEFKKIDSRIKIIKNDINLGLAFTLNKCIENSNGTYIMRHDADDIMLPNRISKQVEVMEKNNLDACGSSAYIFDEDGVWGYRELPEYPSKEYAVLNNLFIHPTVIMRKDKIEEVGMYEVSDSTKKRLEDFDLWIKFLENEFKVYNIKEPLIYFRENKGSYQRKKREYRVEEFKQRLLASNRLNVPLNKKIKVVKPLISLFVPNTIMRFYHRKKAKL